MPVIRWVFFFCLNSLIFYAWFAQIEPENRRLAVRLSIASVLAVAQVILTTLFLGLAIQSLTAVNLSLFNLPVPAALLIRAYRHRRLNAWREAPGSLRAAASIIQGSLLLKILACLTIAAVIWLVFLGIVYPPVEWDSLMYHLPATTYFMQQHSLLDPELPINSYGKTGIDGSIWIIAFPKNIELLFLWTTMLTGTDALTDLVELAFGLLGIIAVYALATKLGVSRQWSIAAGLLFFLTPIVLAQSRSSLIDLSNSVLILISLALLYPAEPLKPLDIVVAGLAAGIVLGAKWSGILFLAWLWLFLAGQHLYLNRSNLKATLSGLASVSALFIGPALLLGSYWYVKNWYLYANPLWPFPISILGRPVFTGVVSKANILSLTFPRQLKGVGMLGSLWTSWREPISSAYDTYAYEYDMHLGGLGPFWFIFALPGIFFVLRWAMARREWRLILLFAALAGMLVLHPENWWTRYTMFLAGIGAIAFVMVRSASHDVGTNRLLDIILIATVTYSTFASFVPYYYAPSKIASLLATPPILRTGGKIRPDMISKAYDYISLKTIEKPKNIAFGSWLRFTYPLWGTRLQNRVNYIDPQNPARWKHELRVKRIDYLLVNIKSPEHKLILRNRSIFRKAFFDRKWGYAVYEFRG